MPFEPVLLKASLGTVLDHITISALWTCVERNELLVKLSSIIIVLGRVINTVLLLLPHLL